MRIRTLLTTGAAVVVSVALPMSAQAKTTELVDRSLFDSTPQRTASSLHLDGPTAGPLGGALDLTITARDGSLPTEWGACEPVDVTAALTISPGEVLSVATTGEACAHQFSGVLQVNAYFDRMNVSYDGAEHKKVKLVGDGLIAAAHQWYGGQASFSAAFSW